MSAVRKWYLCDIWDWYYDLYVWSNVIWSLGSSSGALDINWNLTDNVVKNLLQSDLEFNKKVSLIISGRHPNFPQKEYEELLNILYNNNSDNIYANTLLS